MEHKRQIGWAVAVASLLGFYGSLQLLPSLLDASDSGVVFRECTLILGSAGWLVLVTKRSLLQHRAFGLKRPQVSDVGWGVAATFTSLVLSVSATFALSAVGIKVQSGAALDAIAARPKWIIILIALTAAISEEAVLRSAIIAAVESATGRTMVAIVVAAASFAALHIPVYGFEKGLLTIPSAVFMCSFFAWRRSLTSNIIAHSLLDLLAVSGFLFRD